MKKMKITTLFMCFVLMFDSCATKQGSGALLGAGGGAVIGGIIGAIAGHGKGAAVGAAIGGAVGAGAGAIIGKHMDKVAAETAAQVKNAKVEQVTDANGLKAFDSGILFATNKAELNQSSKNELAKFSTVLKKNADCYVDIYGHTDSTGNDGINIPLSNQRAQSVVAYLENCGVSASQFKNVVGKGSSDPVASNDTKSGRQLNRRVEVYMYASQAMVDAANAGTLK